MPDKRKPWTAPKLIRHGNIKDLTKGGSGPGLEGGGVNFDGDGSSAMGGDEPPGQADKSRP